MAVKEARWGNNYGFPFPEWYNNAWHPNINDVGAYGTIYNEVTTWPEGTDLAKFPRPAFLPNYPAWARRKDGGKEKVMINRIYLYRSKRFNERYFNGVWVEIERTLQSAYYDGIIIYDVRHIAHSELVTEDSIIGYAY